MNWVRGNREIHKKLRGRSRASRATIAPRRRGRRALAAGMTLIELMLACAILMLLATAALPLARMTLKRRKEAELRYDLREMRDAIDRYKDTADKGLIQVQAGTEGYPPDLQTLVSGVQLTGAQNRRLRFLREIPTDPMTGTTDWGMRSVQDDPDTTSWGGQDVFDVFTKSAGTGIDGTAYASW
jgi:general secretion pathway protein G